MPFDTRFFACISSTVPTVVARILPGQVFRASDVGDVFLDHDSVAFEVVGRVNSIPALMSFLGHRHAGEDDVPALGLEPGNQAVPFRGDIFRISRCRALAEYCSISYSIPA